MIKLIKSFFTIDFLMCLLLIVASGNPIFIYSPNVRELYIGLAALAMWYNQRRGADGFSSFRKYASVFFVVMIIQQALIPGLSFSSQIFAIIRILIGVMIIRGLGGKFVSEYIKAMTFVAAISLILFPLSLKYGLLPSVQTSEIGYSMYVYTIIFHDFGGILPRNSGMFWEPGVFQGYLNIAIALALLLPKNKERKWSLVFLVTALLTTVSTTGYLVFGFIIIFYVYKFSRLSSFSRFLYSLIVIGVCMYSFFALDFMHDKIMDNTQDTESAQGRITDYIRYGDYLKNNFFFGVNTGEFEINTGNGLVYMILYYGGLIVFYYIINFWRNFSKKFSTSIVLFLLGVIFITLQGEGFMFYPLYLAFPIVILNFSQPLKYSIDCSKDMT